MEHAINWPAILVSALAFFALGAVWYSALFGKAWMAAVGIPKERIEQSSAVRAFIGTGIAAIVMAYVMSYLLDYSNGHDVKGGLIAGFFTWLGFVGTTFTIQYLFERRNLKLWLINNGYHLVGLLLMGVIQGAWR